MNRRALRNLVPTILAAVTALIYVSSNAYSADPASVHANGRILTAATRMMTPDSGTVSAAVASAITGRGASSSATNSATEISTENALGALASSVHQLSHPDALRDAFASYFAFKSAHPEQVRKPYLYFVDYGLPATTARGYVFDMNALRIIDGPFMVAHGRGSMPNSQGIPTHFSNAFGAATTSLGLYVAQQLYAFTGHAGGQAYHSIGLRLNGVSGGFNDNALARGVVAHGAPYVTDSRAGRSEGCPAMSPTNAQELLPKLANGGLVFLFAPDSGWMHSDPWVTAG